ncbi:MAG TPA: permease-like cell division protein FtsX [Armatimonadota bacterium]
MILSRLEFILRETLSNLTRHGVMTAAAIGTAAVTLSVLGGFLLSAAMLGNLTNDQLRRFEVAAYTAKDTSRQRSLELKKQILAMPGVSSCRLITKEEAWRTDQRKYNELVGQVIKDLKNPMTDEFQIRAVSAERTSEVAAKLRRMEGIEQVSEAKVEMERVVAIARALKVIGISVAMILMLATAYIISSSIRLTVFARRREIQIMQLVGATNGFIRTPFMLEGLLHGLGGAGLACLMVAYGIGSLSQFLSRTLPFLNSVSADLPLTGFYLSLLGLGAGIGALGSALSLRKFLRA